MHRVFYMVKGYIADDDVAASCYESYCKRLWYNEEAYRYEDGFDTAYDAKFSVALRAKIGYERWFRARIPTWGKR